MKEKMLSKLERDRAMGQVTGLQSTLKSMESFKGGSVLTQKGKVIRRWVGVILYDHSFKKPHLLTVYTCLSVKSSCKQETHIAVALCTIRSESMLLYSTDCFVDPILLARYLMAYKDIRSFAVESDLHISIYGIACCV